MIVCLSLALLLGCASFARADESWTLPDDVWKLVPCGEDALAVLEDAVYRLSVADGIEKVTAVLDGKERPVPPNLFAGQEGLYALIPEGASWLLCQGELEESVLELTPVGEMPLPWDASGLMTLLECEEGIVALCGGDIFCWNPDTGATMEWKDWGNQPLMAGGGMLLACRTLEDQVTVEVNQIRLATHAVSHLVTAERTRDVAVSPDGRTVAWLSQTAVTAWQAGEPDSMGYLGITSFAQAHPCAVTNGQRFYLADGRQVLSTQTMLGFDMSDRGLVVGHTGIDLTLNRIREAHGDMDVIDRRLPDGTEAADIAQAIRSGDQSVDIYLLRTGRRGYRALLEKGFCVDLSGDETLMERVLDMPASFAEAVMADGKLYAIPYAAVFAEGTLGCSPAALEAMGLTVEDVPSSVDGLLDALLLWLEEGRMDQVWVSETHEDASLLYGLTLNGYVLCEGGGQRYVDLRDPAFRALMNKYDQVVKRLESREEPDVNAPVLFSMRGLDRFLGTSVFGEYALPWLSNRTTDWQMLRLSALPEQEPLIGVALDVAVINPLSRRKEEAMAFLELMLEELPAQDALYFWPDRAVPVEKPEYKGQTAAIQSIIEEFEEMLARDDLTTDERAAAENSLADTRRDLEGWEAKRWQVSEEAIAIYRAVREDLAVMTSDMMGLILDAGGLSIRQRYEDGQATMDQLVDTLGNLSWSIMMENP